MMQDYWYVNRYTGEKLGHTIDLEIYHKISAQEWLCTMTEYFLRSKSSGGRNGVLHISYREICLFL